MQPAPEAMYQGLQIEPAAKASKDTWMPGLNFTIKTIIKYAKSAQMACRQH